MSVETQGLSGNAGPQVRTNEQHQVSHFFGLDKGAQGILPQIALPHHLRVYLAGLSFPFNNPFDARPVYTARADGVDPDVVRP